MCSNCRVSLGVLLLVAGVLAGCTGAPAARPTEQPASPLPKGTPVPFAILYEYFGGSIYDDLVLTPEADLGPRLVLVNPPDDAQAIAFRLPPEGEEALAGVDYDSHATLILFMGIQGTPGFGVVINEIHQVGQALYVYADFWGTDCSEGCPAVETSPLQIVTFPRSALSTDPARLSLELIPTIHITYQHHLSPEV